MATANKYTNQMLLKGVIRASGIAIA